MLSEEIQSVNTALGAVLGRIDPESAEFIRICRRNLAATADMARELETSGVLPLTRAASQTLTQPTN